MVDAGVLRKTRDCEDGRRVFIELSDECRVSLSNLFAHA
jgi:hypothetical protein